MKKETTYKAYDQHGNITAMPHLSVMEWNHSDMLVKTTKGNESTYYCYNAAGERARKVTVKQNGSLIERIYFGSFEIYREIVQNSIAKERKTVHISDNTKRIAIVEELTIDETIPVTTPSEVVRYQLTDHLGSSCIELNENADILTYEEYHPFGTTAYQKHNTTISKKRYRYVGKENDTETGFYYFGARYYAPWLARWTATDPLKENYLHLSPYNYVANNPIKFIDPDGRKIKPGDQNALQIIRFSVRPEEAQFVSLDAKGFIDTTLIQEGIKSLGEISGCFKDLFSLSIDNRIVEVNLVDDMSIIDGNGEYKFGQEIPLPFNDPTSIGDDWLMLGGEADLTGTIVIEGNKQTFSQFVEKYAPNGIYSAKGTIGKTLLPKDSPLFTDFDKFQSGKSQPADEAYSTNDNFQILLNKRLWNKDNNLDQTLVETYAHETYGHLLSYFLKKSYTHGQDRVNNGNPMEYNKELENKIKFISNEAGENYQKHISK